MRAPLTNEQRDAVLDQVAASGVLRLVERPAGGRSHLTGVAEVDGQEIRLGLQLGPSFPLALPAVLACPWDALGFLPHVTPIDDDGDEGFVCYQDPEGTVLDRRDPSGVAVEALRRAVRLLEAGVRGENRREFADEWESHWGRVAGGGSWTFVGEVPDRPCVVSILIAKDLDRAVVASDEAAVRAMYPACGPVTRTRGALFIPLDAGTEPVPPRPKGMEWTPHDVRAFILRHTKRREIETTRKVSARLRRRQKGRSAELVVLSLPRPAGGMTLFAVEFTGVSGAHPLFKGTCAGVQLHNVLRRDRSYVVPRGGADGGLNRMRALVIGCGAVGSHIAIELARAGVLRLTLVDPDWLQDANVFRHVLGRGSVGENKATALKAHLDRELPYADVVAVPDTVGAALQNHVLDVAGFDLIVCALGNPTVELDLNEHLWCRVGGAPVVFSWVEPYGIGGHALLVRPRDAGCFECLYTPPDSGSAASLANRAAFAAAPPAGRIYGKALSGCGSLFTPYGSADAAQSALLAVRLGVGALSGDVVGSPLLSWKGNARAFEAEGFCVTGRYAKGLDQLDRERYGYVSPRCPVCGTVP